MNMLVSTNKRSRGQRGNIILASIVALAMMSSLAVLFLYRSNNSISISKQNQDVIVARELMRTQLNSAELFLKEAIESVQLNGKLLSVPSGPAAEDFAGLVARYVGAELDSSESATLSMEFLRDVIEAQAYDSNGVKDMTHPFASFANAFPSSLTDPDESDENYVQVSYEFEPAPIEMDSGTGTLVYKYYFTVAVKAYGPSSFSESASTLGGRFDIRLQGAPFSKWATIVNELKNQNGQTLVFAGGDTSAQIQSVYDGPVHINQKGNFYGSPVFNDEFTTAVAESTWQQYTASGYSCCAVFNGSKRGGAETISFPTEMYNSLRLAAGDTSAGASADTSSMTEAEVAALVEHHALGDLPASPTTIPDGVYLSVDGSGSAEATGGIYVEGDANISLNVIKGSADMDATQFSNLDVSHQSCKFQKIRIDHGASGQPTREILVGAEDGCEVTYVYNADNFAEAPAKLNNRVNGNIYVNGKIDELGGESRTRPAIAQDFAFHIAAVKDVRIKSDIQYEDAQYVEMGADGTKGSVVVADPNGEVAGSGVTPTDANIAAIINPESTTVLGISSLKRNIKIHADAPSNINLHAALYAGNSDAYDSSTGYGCNADTSSKRGCGFGVEDWDTKTGAGVLKLLGSVAQYKSQTSGRLSSPPTGYASRYVYDTRLRSDIQPPAFPISEDFDAYPTFHSYRVWQISQNN